jgi:hypothetical protein
MTILNDPHLERLLDRLHERSEAQRSVSGSIMTSGTKPLIACRRINRL